MNMNKKSLYVVLNVALLVPSISAESTMSSVLANKNVNVDLSVRYVDTMQAMQTSKVGAEVSGEMDAKRKELAQSIQEKDEALKKAMSEFESKKSMLSASARSEEEAKIAKMGRKFESDYKETEEELKRLVQQATDGLFQKVEKAVTDLAKTNDYDVVADLQTGRLIYASPKAMITGDLVKEMDRGHKLAQSQKEKAAPAKAVAA